MSLNFKFACVAWICRNSAQLLTEKSYILKFIPEGPVPPTPHTTPGSCWLRRIFSFSFSSLDYYRFLTFCDIELTGIYKTLLIHGTHQQIFFWWSSSQLFHTKWRCTNFETSTDALKKIFDQGICISILKGQSHEIKVSFFGLNG